MLFFFFKQKTAYEIRISDWSSDVCSSDLSPRYFEQGRPRRASLTIQSAFPLLSISTVTDLCFWRPRSEWLRARPSASRGISRNRHCSTSRSTIRGFSKIGECQGPIEPIGRTEERRGGKEGVSTCRTRW